MARTRVIHRCTACAAVAPKWSGQCATCGEWNSLIEEFEAVGGRAGLSPASPVQRITEVSTSTSRPVPTGIGELDRVLGGGLVPGSVTLLGGEPGIGKSTLLLQMLANHRGRCLYVSAEEADKLASAIAIHQFNYKDIRARRDVLKKLIADLKRGDTVQT